MGKQHAMADTKSHCHRYLLWWYNPTKASIIPTEVIQLMEGWGKRNEPHPSSQLYDYCRNDGVPLKGGRGGS